MIIELEAVKAVRRLIGQNCTFGVNNLRRRNIRVQLYFVCQGHVSVNGSVTEMVRRLETVTLQSLVLFITAMQ